MFGTVIDVALRKAAEAERQVLMQRENAVLRRTRLVALTGYGQESDRQRSRTAGFDAHLVKPVDMATSLDCHGVGTLRALGRKRQGVPTLGPRSLGKVWAPRFAGRLQGAPAETRSATGT